MLISPELRFHELLFRDWPERSMRDAGQFSIGLTILRSMGSNFPYMWMGEAIPSNS